MKLISARNSDFYEIFAKFNATLIANNIKINYFIFVERCIIANLIIIKNVLKIEYVSIRETYLIGKLFTSVAKKKCMDCYIKNA